MNFLNVTKNLLVLITGFIFLCSDPSILYAQSQPTQFFYTRNDDNYAEVRITDTEKSFDQLLHFNFSQGMNVSLDKKNDIIFIEGKSDVDRDRFSDDPIIYKSDLDGGNKEIIFSRNNDDDDIDDIIYNPVENALYFTLEVQFEADRIWKLNLNDNSTEQVILESENSEIISMNVDTLGQKLYWSIGGGSIKRSNLDGSGIEIFVPDSDIATARNIEFDHARNKVYFMTSTNTGQILQRLNFDKTERDTVVQNLGISFYQVDPNEDRILLKDNSQSRVNVMNLDGTGIRSFLIGGAASIFNGMEIDFDNETFYFTTQFSNSNDRVRSLKFDGSGLVDMIQNVQEPAGLAVDPIKEKVYILDQERRMIIKSDYDGGNPDFVVTSNIDFEEDHRFIKIDPFNEKLYWVNDDDIYRSNLDGFGQEIVFSNNNFRDIRGFELDLENGFIYFADFEINAIRRVDIDNLLPAETIESGFPFADNPSDIALDVKNNKVYWVNLDQDTFVRANLDGSNVEEVLISGIFSPRGIDIDLRNQQLYWADSGTTPDAIFRVNTDGTINEEFLQVAGLPDDIAFIQAPQVVEDLPVVQSFQRIISEDDTLQFSTSAFRGSFSDEDPGDTLKTVRFEILPQNGILSLNNSSVSINQEIASTSLNELTYIPSANFNGRDTLVWNGSDGKAFAADSALVTITINAVNDLPELVDITPIIFPEDSTTQIGLDTLVSDVETPDEAIDWQVTSDTSDIIITIDSTTRVATFTATPDFNGTGLRAFFTATDEAGASVSDTTSVTITPVDETTDIKTLTLAESWNLIGLPVNSIERGFQNLFPNAIDGTLFEFAGGSYQSATELELATGYWIRLSSADTLNLEGVPIDTLDIPLNAGWNMITGGTADRLLSNLSDPDGVIIPGTLFRFEGAYTAADSLLAGEGYWLRASDAGTISVTGTSNSTTTNNRVASNRKTNSPALQSEATLKSVRKDFHKLIVSVPEGPEQELLFGRRLPEQIDVRSFSLPPKAPGGILDVRFSGDMRLSHKDRSQITITTNGDYSPQLHITKGEAGSVSGTLKVIGSDGSSNRYDLQGGQVITLPKAKTLNLTLETTLQELVSDLPQEFTLQQNYPNPFNPTTTIEYGLPSSAEVRLTVYNVMGQEVATLVNQQQSAGFHSVNFDASRLSSGMYLYRIEAGEFTQTRKLMLVK